MIMEEIKVLSFHAFAFKYFVFILCILFLSIRLSSFCFSKYFLFWDMVVGILFLSSYRHSVLETFFVLTHCMFCVSHFYFGILILEI